MKFQPPKREYPGHADYDLAVQNIGKFVFDPVLRAGTPRSRRGGGAPLSYPGGFAKAYVVDCGGKTYALRVWLHDIGDAAHHYHAVAAFFGQDRMDCFVEDFHFIPDGILVNGQRFPILRMEWVSGSTLGDFITRHIGDRGLLRVAADAFLGMVRTLHQGQVAHGDLQAENMIVWTEGRTVRYKLIDYDTLVVPALVGRPISSVGLQCYQHPKRGASSTATIHDDYFSELVIYLCLLALSETPGLWSEFPRTREKELLFVPEDFSAASPTPVFRRLYQQGGMVRPLAVVLWNFTRYPGISQLQPLEKVIDLAAEALASKAPGGQEQAARNSFDAFLAEKLRMGKAGSSTLPKSLLDDDAFVHSRAPSAAGSRSTPRNTPWMRQGPPPTPGTASESFLEKLKGLQSARPVVLGPTASRAVSTVAMPTIRPAKPPIRRKGWVWAGVVAALLVWWVVAANSPPRIIPVEFIDSPVQGKSFHAMAGINMVWIAPGSFQMGDSTGKGSSDEKPVHEVRLSGYWLGESDVTQGQWSAVMGNNPSNFKGGSLPVENVSWDDAVTFCQKLTESERARGHLPAGMQYRLPTEAQWEYACRAGTTGDYAGDLDAMAWYGSNSGNRTHEVKTKRPNAWGLYDMHGNVWQWCSDGYGSYSAGLQIDPTGSSTGAFGVFRGGSWNRPGTYCRSAFRDRHAPKYRMNFLGFRLAAVPSSGSGATTRTLVAGQGVASARDERRTEAGKEMVEGARPGEERQIEIASAVSVTMCWVPAGSFTMGSPVSEGGRSNDEEQVQARISRGFWLAKTECTQKVWKALMGTNPSSFKGEDLPVEQISWNDCQTFIGKLRQAGEGWRFDLPTEAQWEYGCRAGASGPYAGDLNAMAWCESNSGGKTHPVGTKNANAWGLMDMHGNVWEWCRDSYQETLPGRVDPYVKNGAIRVSRGGSWLNPGTHCRSADRLSFTPSYHYNGLGFRLAAVPASGL